MLAIEAQAKINWFLRVRGKRPDGYHEISSLMQCVSLHDELTFEDFSGISITTEAPIPLDENLVMRAAIALRETSATKKGARIGLVKKIPIAAGLGGGSSDAAATLKGLNNLWRLGLTQGNLHEDALKLGSDVPFFIDGPAALVGGRGEEITPVNIKRRLTLLLVNPRVGVSAGWAYSEMKEYSGDAPAYSENFLKALDAGDFKTLGEMAVNDLYAPVVRKHPAVGELKEKLMAEGALFAAMSGSGPTVFGVFSNREQAQEAAETIKAPWWAVAETLA